MTAADQVSGQKLNKEQRLSAYQDKLRSLKDRSALREIMERDLLLEFIRVNQASINEYPLLQAQQQTIINLLCGRTGHPGYEYIHKIIGNFIILLAHYEKAIKVGDKERADSLQTTLINNESLLIKCVQGIVYAMALITDNFEELVLRYFGQDALPQYTKLIEELQLDTVFWKKLMDTFVVSRVGEAHKEILDGEKYQISKEKNFLIIRFLFDDILARLNPTNQKIDKTRIQQVYVKSRTDFESRRQAKMIQNTLTKGISNLSAAKDITAKEMLQAARIACIDPITTEFEQEYTQRILDAKAYREDPEAAKAAAARDPEAVKQEQIGFKFKLDQVVAIGVGASIAIGVTSDFFFKALGDFIPDQVNAIRPLSKDFSIPTLEKILFFMMENHMVHILSETGQGEGSKIQVRSGRARRVSEAKLDSLENMTKIRKKQLFAKDTTRDGTLLFKPKTIKQMAAALKILSLEPELQKEIQQLWQNALFRVDIMVLVNLELVARTSTNLKVRLAEILQLYGVASRKPTPEETVLGQPQA